jgi:hypothetical protein
VTVLVSVFSSDKNNKYAKHNGKNKISYPPKIKIKIKTKIPSLFKISIKQSSPNFPSISPNFHHFLRRIKSNSTMRPPKRPIQVVTTWVRRQPPKVKAFLAVVAGMTALVLLRFIVHDHDNLFVAAEAVHSIGISVLIYKLMKEKTCAGN